MSQEKTDSGCSVQQTISVGVSQKERRQRSESILFSDVPVLGSVWWIKETIWQDAILRTGCSYMARKDRKSHPGLSVYDMSITGLHQRLTFLFGSSTGDQHAFIVKNMPLTQKEQTEQLIAQHLTYFGAFGRIRLTEEEWSQETSDETDNPWIMTLSAERRKQLQSYMIKRFGLIHKETEE